MQVYLDVKPTTTIDGIEYYEYPLDYTYYISKQGDVYNADLCLKLKTSIIQSGKGYYTANIRGKRTRIHRMLAITFLAPIEGKDLVDHISRNTLDNRLENLRWCSHSENSQNSGKRGTSTKYNGVHKRITKSNITRYVASIRKDGVRHLLGTFDTAELAGIAYNEKAQELGYLSYNVID